MRWKALFWKSVSSTKSVVEKEVKKLNEGNQRGKKEFIKLVKKLEARGAYVLASTGNSCKKVKSEDGEVNIFELRDTVNGFRYYFSETHFEDEADTDTQDLKSLIVLLGACGNKDSQNRDIERARERLDDISLDNIKWED